MKTIKLETEMELDYPTIVKIVDDYYVVSKKYFPTTSNNTLCDRERHIAINLNDGTWYDWDDRGVNIIKPFKEIFKKGTKFEIEI